MKQYFNFLRSMATVLLAILYVGVSLFSFSSAQAETAVDVITEITSEEVSHIEVVENIDSHEILEIEAFPSSDSEVIFSQQVEVDPLEKTISEQEEIVVSTQENTQGVAVKICNETNSPVITLQNNYIEIGLADATAVNILNQINPTAVDGLDGVVSVLNNLDTLTLDSGLNQIEFSAQNSVNCTTIVTADIFVIGQEQPVCQSGFVYARIVFPESLTASLGTNTSVQSGEWFPVMVDGVTFSESESDIVTNPDIAITRVGTTLFVNVAPGVVDASELANSIANSVEFSGGSAVSAMAFSGDVALITFQAEECPIDICTAFGGPSVTSTTSTVTIDENTTLTEEELFALFGITAEDLDGEGLVSITSNLSSISFQNEGVYTITITLTDNEGCQNIQSVTLIVEGEEDGTPPSNGGGGRRTGSQVIPPVTGEVLGATVCEPYLTTFMKMGSSNPKEEVVKLQTFLNEYMGENLAVDGIYGQATFEAVKRFQIREADEILKPWGITEATGITRETTTRRINNIMCPELNMPMPILYCATTGNVLFPDGTVVYPDGTIVRSKDDNTTNNQAIIVPTNNVGEIAGIRDFRYEK